MDVAFMRRKSVVTAVRGLWLQQLIPCKQDTKSSLFRRERWKNFSSSVPSEKASGLFRLARTMVLRAHPAPVLLPLLRRLRLPQASRMCVPEDQLRPSRVKGPRVHLLWKQLPLPKLTSVVMTMNSKRPFSASSVTHMISVSRSILNHLCISIIETEIH